MTKLTHLNNSGQANMVDITDKTEQIRTAEASGRIILTDATVTLIKENLMRKGDVLRIAEIAAIQAAKRTPELIPLCHNILINKVDVTAELSEKEVTITAKVKCIGRTGVEMEALTAVSVGLLTIYDMCKAVDKNMIITDIFLKEKIKKDII